MSLGSDSKKSIYFALGMIAVLIVAFIGSTLLTPAQSDDILVINRGGGNSSATDCINIGSGSFIVKNSTDNCYIRSVVGSSDISVTQQSNTLTIDYNGTSSGGVTSITNGTGISVNQTTGNVLITNTLPDNTSCANVGSGSQVYKDGECNFRTIIGSSDISVTQQSDTITIDYNGSSSGVTSLTSNNTAIDLSGSTGAITIKPYYQLLAINTTITNTTSGTNTVVNQVSGTVSDLAVSNNAGNLKASEKLNSGSVLAGKTVNSITLGLKKIGSPTGTLSACVMNNAGTCLFTFGTMSIPSLTTSYVLYTFTALGSSYTLSVGEYVGISSSNTQGVGASVQVSATTPNQFDGTNSVVSQFTGVSWTDANTWDLGSSTANGAWKLELVSSRNLETSFTAKKYLYVVAELRVNGTGLMAVKLNNDTTINYASINTVNGVTTPLASRSVCEPIGATIITSGDRMLLVMEVDNNLSSDRKILNGYMGYGADSSVSTTPSKSDFICKWGNTSDQINKIGITGLLTTSSKIWVWGYD